MAETPDTVTAFDATAPAPKPGTVAHHHWFDYIGEQTLADETETSLRFWQDLRSKGGGPKYYVPTPRLVRYRRIDVFRWFDDRARLSVAQAADPSAVDDASLPPSDIEGDQDHEAP